MATEPFRPRDEPLPDISIYPVGGRHRMPSLAHERARMIIMQILMRLFAPVSLVAAELASKTTMGRENLGKKEDYARLGVPEYVQFDPLQQFLRPGLRVFRQCGAVYRPVSARRDGAVPSAVLGGYAWLQDGIYLRLRDRATSLLAPTPDEVAAAEAAARVEAEAARAQADARVEAADEEIARLRAEIARLRGDTTPA